MTIPLFSAGTLVFVGVPTLTGLVSGSFMLIAIGLAVAVCLAFNSAIKTYVFRPLYRRWPDIERFIGPGERPTNEGAMCGSGVLPETIENIVAPSPCQAFGMPSGHAQAAGCFIVLIGCLTNTESKGKAVVIVLALYALLVALSRTTALPKCFAGHGCHTANQVLVGLVLGILFGFLSVPALKSLEKRRQVQ